MEKLTLRNLLQAVEEQQKRMAGYKENYNVFYALRIRSKELIHSRIIADLLSSNGYHGLGTIPLKLFMEVIGCSEFICDDKAEVVDEKSTDEGRRIDLYLKDAEGRIVIIENKIYACDQQRQLTDYYEYGLTQTSEDKLKLFYLTLNGTKASAYSTEGLSAEKYACISYEHDILSWLKKLKDIPMASELRAVLSQYEEVLEHLTTDNINMDDYKEIINLIDTDNDVSNLFSLAEKVNTLKSLLPSRCCELLARKLKEITGEKPLLEKGAYWIETKHTTKSGVIWLKIEVADYRVWCSFVEWADGKQQVFSNEAVELLKGSEVLGMQSATNYWWWIDEQWNYPTDFNDASYLTLDNIKALVNEDSLDYITKCANLILEQVKKLNEYRPFK